MNPRDPMESLNETVDRSPRPFAIIRKQELKVVRAAIRDKNGVVYSVPVPGRHHNVIALMREKGVSHLRIDKQGFILSNGAFATRDEALVVARNANQVEKIIGGTLTSEDLW